MNKNKYMWNENDIKMTNTNKQEGRNYYKEVLDERGLNAIEVRKRLMKYDGDNYEKLVDMVNKGFKNREEAEKFIDILYFGK